jgi:hypothetical protein
MYGKQPDLIENADRSQSKLHRQRWKRVQGQANPWSATPAIPPSPSSPHQPTTTAHPQPTPAQPAHTGPHQPTTTAHPQPTTIGHPQPTHSPPPQATHSPPPQPTTIGHPQPTHSPPPQATHSPHTAHHHRPPARGGPTIDASPVPRVERSSIVGPPLAGGLWWWATGGLPAASLACPPPRRWPTSPSHGLPLPLLGPPLAAGLLPSP